MDVYVQRLNQKSGYNIPPVYFKKCHDKREIDQTYQYLLQTYLKKKNNT